MNIRDPQRLAEQYPHVIPMVERAKDHLSVSWNELEVFSRYQTSLDNQLYKSIKTLREAQEWRAEKTSQGAGEGCV